MPARILAVIVLYKSRPVDSPALNTLLAAISHLQLAEADVRILLYDNTPGGQDIGPLPNGTEYFADIENSGLPKAYNYALEIASRDGFDWLLTLDQDTTLPDDFLCKLCPVISMVAPKDSIAAIAPRLCDQNRVISPYTATSYWARTKSLPDSLFGIPGDPIYPANSAATIRVSALKSIGGYDPDFRLEFSDTVMFHRLQCKNLKIFFAGHIHVSHNISARNLRERSTPARYYGALCAEQAFYDEYLGRIERVMLLLKAISRPFYRVWEAGGDLSFLKVTLKALCRTAFYPRKRRISSWHNPASSVRPPLSSLARNENSPAC
jgi:GT2 family glycosyltransferase